MLSSLTGAVDRRFLLGAVLPSTLFVLLLAFVVLAGADPARAGQLWGAAGGFHLVALVAAVGVLAVVVSAATPGFVRLAEGYWPFGLTLGRRHHQRRLAKLARKPDGYRVIHLSYPLPTQPDQVMPTRFGNILRSAELYPTDRYGIDTAVVWPRLYQVLPDRQVAQVATAKANVDLLVTTSFLAGAFAVTSAALAAWWCCLGGAVASWLTYRGSLGAARTYGQLVRTAFDVHRGDLLTQLGMTEEPGVWERLAQHWYRGVPL